MVFLCRIYYLCTKIHTTLKKFLIRAVSGLAYAAAIVLSLLFCEAAFRLIVIVFAILGAYEIYNMLSHKNHAFDYRLAVDIGGCLAMMYAAKVDALWPVMLYIVIRMIIQVFSKGEALSELTRSGLVLMYVALPLSALVACLNFPGGSILILIAFCFIWISDTGAYMVGSLIGKHKMCPRISPKKSWEGLCGGLALCGVIGFVLPSVAAAAGFPGAIPAFSAIEYALIGVAIGVLSTLGDLVESLIKRSVGVKDSGVFLPGHGGALDRIDSLLLVAPALLVIISCLMERQ